MSLFKKLLIGLGVTMGLSMLLSCNFNVEEPNTEDTVEKFTDSYSVKATDGGGCISAGSGTTALNSNDIRSLYAIGNTMWIATWGGGISSMTTTGTITTYRAAATNLDNDFCSKVAGNTNAMASCFNTSSQYTLHYFNGTAWAAGNPTGFTPDTNPVLDIDYSGSRFYVIKDQRVNGFLDDTAAGDPDPQSIVYSYNDTAAAQVNTGGTGWQTTAQPNPVTITSQAVVGGVVDRDGDYLMLGYFSDTDPTTQHPPGLQHPNKLYKHLSLHRRTTIMVNKASGPTIRPMEFGQTWPNIVSVYPKAIGYVDKTITATPVEQVYAASQSKFYRMEIQSYGSITVGNIITTDTSDGLPSTNVREIVYKDSAAWVATDAGLGVYPDSSGWETISQTNGLPSNNIHTVAVFNNAVWVGTDAGLCKIVKK